MSFYQITQINFVKSDRRFIINKNQRLFMKKILLMSIFFTCITNSSHAEVKLINSVPYCILKDGSAHNCLSPGVSCNREDKSCSVNGKEGISRAPRRGGPVGAAEGTSAGNGVAAP